MRVLLIDPDPSRVRRIRQAFRMESPDCEVQLASGKAQAMDALKKQQTQIIFCVDSVIPELGMDFVAATKKIDGYECSAFISLIKCGQKDKQDILQQTISGFDAMLVEPFSLNTFREALETAKQLVRERSQEFEARVIKSALVDVITYIDATALNLKYKRDVQRKHTASERFRETMAACSARNEKLYYDLVVETFIHIKPPKALKTQYKGASKRLRRAAERRAVAAMLDEEK